MVGIVLLAVLTGAALLSVLAVWVTEGVDMVEDAFSEAWATALGTFGFVVIVAGLVAAMFGFVTWDVHWSEAHKAAEAWE